MFQWNYLYITIIRISLAKLIGTFSIVSLCFVCNDVGKCLFLIALKMFPLLKFMSFCWLCVTFFLLVSIISLVWRRFLTVFYINGKRNGNEHCIHEFNLLTMNVRLFSKWVEWMSLCFHESTIRDINLDAVLLCTLDWQRLNIVLKWIANIWFYKILNENTKLLSEYQTNQLYLRKTNYQSQSILTLLNTKTMKKKKPIIDNNKSWKIPHIVSYPSLFSKYALDKICHSHQQLASNDLLSTTQSISNYYWR